jgi:pimeloyl-ACP methyl ester carboxylesterase
MDTLTIAPVQEKLYLIKSNFDFKYIEEGEGKTIVLLHGLFGTLSNWENVLAHFGRYNRIIVPILPLYDTSFKDTSLDSLVNYLHIFFLKLQLKNVVLMGNSLGGQIALKYTLKHPELINKLIITGSAGLYENAMGTTFPKRSDYNYVKEKVCKTFYNPQIASEKLVENVYSITQSIPKSLRIVRFARESQKNNLASELPDIKVPTLILWGKNDTVTPVDVAYRFYHLIPNARIKIIDECGHVPMMEQPEQFNYWVERFINAEMTA